MILLAMLTVRTYSTWMCASSAVPCENRGVSDGDPSSGGTRTRILRAAEQVFAQEGYAGATMRRIAGDAGVGVSLVVHHFQTKERLYTSVFEARRYLLEERLARLDAALDTGGPDVLDNIVAAMVEPVLELLDDPEHRWYVRLVLRHLGVPTPGQRDVLEAMFNPLAQQFIAAFEGVLPGKPAGFYEWAYVFSLGALTQILRDERVAHLAPATPADPDKSRLLIRYITGALRCG